MFNSEKLMEKWGPLLNAESCDPIKDSHRKAVTAVLLENQERFLREQSAFEQGGMLTEAPTNSANAAGASGGFSGSSAAAGPVAGFDPVLISLIRRSMPNLVAYVLAAVQPMNGPTGLIFAMRSRYSTQSGTEALFDEPDTAFSSTRGNASGSTGGNYSGQVLDGPLVGFGTTGDQRGTNPSVLSGAGTTTGIGTQYNVGQGMETGTSESLGETGEQDFGQMAFSIEKVTVTAKSRALKAEYSLELAQDLRAIHGLNA